MTIKIELVFLRPIKRLIEEYQAAIDHTYQKPNFYAGQVYYKGSTPTVDEFVAHATSEAKKRTDGKLE